MSSQYGPGFPGTWPDGDVPTLAHVQAAAEYVAVARSGVESGDADVAIDSLLDALRSVQRALIDFEQPGAVQCLNLAAQAVDRGAAYGDTHKHFETVARLWSSLLHRDITREEVAMCLVALKLARLVHCPDHTDSWADVAGYAACGYEVSQP